MMPTRIISQCFLLPILVSIVLSFTLVISPTIGEAAPFLDDEVLVGRKNGQIDVYRNGQLNRSLSINNGIGYTVRGLCFSTNRTFLYVTSAKYEESTDKYYSRISRFDNNGQLVNNIFIPDPPSNQPPYSCITDAAGYLYVEFRKHADKNPLVRKYDATGRQINEFIVPTDISGYGSIDLLADQRTLIYVTSTRIRRFDLMNNAPLPDLVNLSSNSIDNCGAVRARQNGEIWAICGKVVGGGSHYNVLRLKADGQTISTYSSLRFLSSTAAKFSPDQLSFWAINRASSTQPWLVTKLGIEAGGQAATDIGADMYAPPSFAVYGEYTAATTQCSDGIDNDSDGQVDFPNDVYCNSPGQAYETRCWKVPFFNRVVCLGTLKRLLRPFFSQ